MEEEGVSKLIVFCPKSINRSFYPQWERSRAKTKVGGDKVEEEEMKVGVRDSFPQEKWR